tara:strand:+ start:180 stop:581 length:402 start_codon:yes stop_codon:yes gene_type:complete
MKKTIIYTNETCSHCKTIKEELTKNNIKFEERLTSKFEKEWMEIIRLTNMAMVPTICYENNYFIPQRDFGNVEGLINLLENFKESSFSEEKQLIEMIKTLSYNILMAFQRVDSVLKQIETKLNIEENVDKSTD